MNKQSLRLIVTYLLFTTVIAACGNKTPEDRLSEININEETFKKFSPCEKIHIFAEIGSEFVDIDHGEVLIPGWMYKEIRNSSSEINLSCIEQELSKYLSIIKESKNSRSYRDTSLKIHSLFYLSENLGLLRNPEINALLRTTACEEKVQYSQLLFFMYYFAQRNDLLEDEDMEKQKFELCSNS